MNLLTLDIETTGLDPKTDAIIEIGCALYSVEDRAVLWSFSTVVPIVKHNPIPEINGITDGMLSHAAWALPLPLDALRGSTEIAAVVAHNAEFDRSFATRFRALDKSLKGLPWICSQSDLTFPKARGSQHLAHLAADHGLALGAQRHRALADVLLICDLLSCVTDLAEQVTEALKPRVLFQSLQSFEQNAEAKKCGFRWEKETKRWLRRLPKDTPLEPTRDRPFKVRLAEED